MPSEGENKDSNDQTEIGPHGFGTEGFQDGAWMCCFGMYVDH